MQLAHVDPSLGLTRSSLFRRNAARRESCNNLKLVHGSQQLKRCKMLFAPLITRFELNQAESPKPNRKFESPRS
jgi:hypothetical protein